jgi:hypothetical protein
LFKCKTKIKRREKAVLNETKKSSNWGRRGNTNLLSDIKTSESPSPEEAVSTIEIEVIHPAPPTRLPPPQKSVLGSVNEQPIAAYCLRIAAYSATSWLVVWQIFVSY